jgi:hypothetical protein
LDAIEVEVAGLRVERLGGEQDRERRGELTKPGKGPTLPPTSKDVPSLHGPEGSPMVTLFEVFRGHIEQARPFH